MLHQINDHTLVDFEDVAAVLEYEYNLRLYYCCIVRPAGVGPFVIPLTEEDARHMISDMKKAADDKAKWEMENIARQKKEELLSSIEHGIK